MKLNIKNEEGIVSITIEGNLVGSDNNELNTELQKIIDSGMVKLIVNMKNVAQLDSFALGILATSGSEIESRNGKLKFAELQPFVATLFKMMRMNDLFDIYDTYEEALDSFKK
ncbi:MAG: hypothetical protein CR982_09175 [Candidatus Cloacimonadota bacterium]|nr:MAG: hypothetical protein CR982_09175 [Candidatus Cloacimonadota bacterium]PIE77538.1 MAG: hypothetical protein CSA15_12480 [Candidatus Delongbacteria bacterium]